VPIFRLVLTSLLLTIGMSVQSGAWELEKEGDGIKVYTMARADSDFKAFRAEMRVAYPLRQVAVQLLDVEAMVDWLHDCSESELISRTEDDEFIVYQKTDAPWPVSDRDYVFKAKVAQDQVSKIVEMRFSALVEAGQATDQDCVQVTEMKGYWRMTPEPSGVTLVEYETHADPGGQLPAWLANSFVVDQPWHTFKNLRERLVHSHPPSDSVMPHIKNP